MTATRATAVTVAAALVAVAATGCASDPASDDSVDSVAEAVDVSVADVAGGAPIEAGVPTAADRNGAVAAALDVRADGCGPRVGFGSGSVIGDGLAVTAAHVVAGATDVEVIDTDGERAGASVVHFDPDLDLALLRLDEAVGDPIALRADEVVAGEPGVVALPRWTADELDLDVVDVVVTRTVNISTTDIYRLDHVDRAGFEIDGGIGPGDSGALVVAPGGGVGVVWARSRIADQRAWVVDLPAVVLDPARRNALVDPVDTGDCIR